MRIQFLITWFLFVSYSQAISNSGLHTSSTAEKKDLNYSTTTVQTQQHFENYGRIKETMMFHKKDEEKQELLSHASVVKKAHSGRGAGGGSSDVDRHHRSSASSTTSLLPWSSRFCVSLTLILMPFFHVKLL